MSAAPVSFPVLLAQASAGDGGNSLLGWYSVLLVLTGLTVGGWVLRRTTRAGVLAAATAKEAVRQPVFFLSIAIALLVLLLNTVLPFFSLGDDVKMLKDCGLATLLIVGLLVAVWTAGTTIYDEIEGRTAMTLLSKPINRRQFIVGKYLGIMRAVAILMVVVGAVFVALVFYKVGYDAREGGGGNLAYFEWVEGPRSVLNLMANGNLTGALAGSDVLQPQAERLYNAFQVIPSMVLVYLEIAVLTAIAVAVATRLPMVVNLSVCFTVFIVGHLTGVLVQVGGADGGVLVENVRFVAGLIATVLPALPAYSSEAAVARDALVPPEYLAWAGLYTVCYAAAAILVAFLLFEDRDLA